MKRDTAITAAWALLALAAILWPSKFIGPLDGLPLDAPAEALLAGLVLPALLWFDSRYLRRRIPQLAVIALAVWKAATGAAMTQQGLCLRSSAAEPFSKDVQTIVIDEPLGVLRSWDVRADWRSPDPQCTAVITRPLDSLESFPAWFLNIADFPSVARDVRMRMSGVIVARDPHPFSLEVGPDMTVERRMDGVMFAEQPLPLTAGSHVLDVSMRLKGNGWRFEPTMSGTPLWNRALTFVREPTGLDRLFAPWAWLVAPLIVLALIAGWVWHVAINWQPGVAMTAAVVVLSAVSGILALQTPSSVTQRAAGLVGLFALAVPVPQRLRNVRGAFLLVGVPWLTFFAAYTFRDIGHFTGYSQDDWLAYQVAGYRIVMHGYWLEGGTATFDYQPLYRWITGLLHLVFGDSSVGEFYWDASWLVCGALLAFWLVRARAGFRWGLAAAALTFGTFMLGTTWWFTGRGLSEVSAAGWGFAAMFCLLRARLGNVAVAAMAGAFATLMFYTRLNHLLFPVFLPALLLSLRVPAVLRQMIRALGRLRPALVITFAGVFGTGVILLMLRNWRYTGVFGLFHGTSLRHNDTGLRPWSLLDPVVSEKVWHSLQALAFLNEPARPDLRAALVSVGLILAALAMLQVPAVRRLPAAIVIACLGAGVGALFAHTHAYPGRMSLHLIPLAVALTMIGFAACWQRLTPVRR